MNLPDAKRLALALDATWPPARLVACGPWLLREGQGGGQRVSAATAEAPVSPSDVETAEAAMRGLSQAPLFRLGEDEGALDALLAARGYTVGDPTAFYAAPVDSIAAPLAPAETMSCWPPLAIQREIWAAGGIGPARLAVMERATAATTILGRSGDTPAGTVFVARDGDVAMVHALEVTAGCRRRGIGARLMQAAANWAKAEGATLLTLAVTIGNQPGNALYQSLGFTRVSAYHYRKAAVTAP